MEQRERLDELMQTIKFLPFDAYNLEYNINLITDRLLAKEG